MIVKCEKCGQEYELNDDETLSNFQCECGGKLINLKPPKHSEKSSEGLFDKWNQQSTTIKAISLIGIFVIAAVLIIGITGMLNPSQNIAQTTATPTSNNTSTPQVQAGTVEINNPKIESVTHFKDVYNPTFKMNTPVEDYISYYFSGELIPSTNFDYLEIIIKYYGNTEKEVLARNSVWSISSVKAGEKYVLRSEENITGTPKKADIMVFTSPNSNDDSQALYKTTVVIKNN